MNKIRTCASLCTENKFTIESIVFLTSFTSLSLFVAFFSCYFYQILEPTMQDGLITSTTQRMPCLHSVWPCCVCSWVIKSFFWLDLVIRSTSLITMVLWISLLSFFPSSSTWQSLKKEWHSSLSPFYGVVFVSFTVSISLNFFVFVSYPLHFHHHSTRILTSDKNTIPYHTIPYHTTPPYRSVLWNRRIFWQWRNESEDYWKVEGNFEGPQYPYSKNEGHLNLQKRKVCIEQFA